jgi:hypothetical protein
LRLYVFAWSRKPLFLAEKRGFVAPSPLLLRCPARLCVHLLRRILCAPFSRMMHETISEEVQIERLWCGNSTRACTAFAPAACQDSLRLLSNGRIPAAFSTLDANDLTLTTFMLRPVILDTVAGTWARRSPVARFDGYRAALLRPWARGQSPYCLSNGLGSGRRPRALWFHID